jgi:2,4-dienoyl-CoA reductase-like NADH-dependent reductase (Old Yellow Enzyme family)
MFATSSCVEQLIASAEAAFMAAKPIRSATPGQIGTTELKNRRVMPAIGTDYTRQNLFTDATVDDSGLRAKGGVRLIIIEAAALGSGKRDSFRNLDREGSFAVSILRNFVRARVRSNQERDWRWSSQSYSSP